MSFRKNMADALYFAVGAVATGVEAIADSASKITEKGAAIVAKGKKFVDDYYSLYEIPDHVEPAVTIEEDTEDLPKA